MSGKASCVHRRREHVGRLEFQVAFLCVSGGPPTRPSDGSSRAGSTRKCVATKCFAETRHGRAAQVSARHVNQRISAADHPTTAEWTDRQIVFERRVGEYATSSGEVLGVQLKCAVLLERVPPELRTHHLLTCGSRPDYAIMRQTA